MRTRQAKREDAKLRLIFRHDPASLARVIRRLDRLAGRINPFLLAVAIGLGILDFAGLVNMVDSRNLPASRTAAPAAPQLSAFGPAEIK
ncbi:MAG: hypothetical protein WB710_02205 [Stellaceae bacterium]